MSQSIAVLGSNQVPLSYQVPVPGTLTALAATGTFDGSGASEFQPCLSFYDSDGNLLARATAPTVAAGGSAEVSWFPRVAGNTEEPAQAVYFLSAPLIWGGPAIGDPDVNLSTSGACSIGYSTAYYQAPGGVRGSALALRQSPGQGAAILGNLLAYVTDATAFGGTEVFSVILSYAAGDLVFGTGPYVDAGMSVGTGYIVKADGTDFSPFTLVVPPLAAGYVAVGPSYARMYLPDGTQVGPTNPWPLADGDSFSCNWVTAVDAWD